MHDTLAFEASTPLRWLPPRREAPGPAPAVLGVHGYGQPPATLLAWLAGVVPPEAALLVPAGPSTFYRRPDARGSRRGGVGHGWIADPARVETDRRNDRLLAAALDRVAARRPLDPARTWLVGYSQGVGVATHFFRHHPARVAGLVGLAGGVPRADRPKLGALAGKPVLWITGLRDPSYPPDYEAEVVAAFRAAGADLAHVPLDAGHDLLDQARAPLADWLARHLRA